MGWHEDRAAAAAREARLKPRLEVKDGQFVLVHTGRDGADKFRSVKAKFEVSLSTGDHFVVTVDAVDGRTGDTVRVPVREVRVAFTHPRLPDVVPDGRECVDGMARITLPSGEEGEVEVRRVRLPTPELRALWQAERARQASAREARLVREAEEAARAEAEVLDLRRTLHARLSPRARGLMARKTWGRQPGPLAEVRREVEALVEAFGLPSWRAMEVARELIPG